MHFHCDRGYESHAAVNVKIHADWFSPEAAAEFPGLTWEWIESTLTEREREEWWQAACEEGWSRADEAAKEAFGPSAKVYSEGRCGGWLVVYLNGRPAFSRSDCEEWEPADHLRWAAFESECQAIAADVPYLFTDLIGANVYDAKRAEGFARLAEGASVAGLADQCREWWGSAPYGQAVPA